MSRWYYGNSWVRNIHQILTHDERITFAASCWLTDGSDSQAASKDGSDGQAKTFVRRTGRKSVGLRCFLKRKASPTTFVSKPLKTFWAADILATKTSTATKRNRFKRVAHVVAMFVYSLPIDVSWKQHTVLNSFTISLTFAVGWRIQNDQSISVGSLTPFKRRHWHAFCEGLELRASLVVTFWQQ